jgi:WD40 repeat protein
MPDAAVVEIEHPPRRWLRSFRHGGPYRALVVSLDGRLLIAATADGATTVWRLADGRVLHHLPSSLTLLEREYCRSVYLTAHPDGVRLYVSVDLRDGGDVCTCWNLESGEQLGAFDEAPLDAMAAPADEPDADLVRARFSLSAYPSVLVPGSGTAITLEGYVLRQWRLNDGSAPAPRPRPRPLYPRLCPAGHTTLDLQDGRLVLSRADQPAPVPILTRQPSPWVLAIEPAARRLALSVDRTIELWRCAAAPQRFHTFRSDSAAACGSFEPSRRWLATGHRDGSLHLWDLLARARMALVETGPLEIVEVLIDPTANFLVALRADHILLGFFLEDLRPHGRWASDVPLRDLCWRDDGDLFCRSAEGEVLLRWPSP